MRLRLWALLLFLTSLLPFEEISASETRDWIEMIRVARDPSISLEKKQGALTGASEHLRALLKKETGKSDAALKRLLTQTDDESLAFRKRLHRCAPDCEIRDLYSEINQLAGLIVTQGRMKACSFENAPAEYAKSLEAKKTSLLRNQNRYQPYCEGSCITSEWLVVDANADSDGKRRAWPLLYGGDEIARLMNEAGSVVFESQISGSARYLGRDVPSLEKSGLPKEIYAGLRRKEELKETVYLRAITNSIKTKVAIDYGFGKISLAEARTAAAREIDRACKHCDPSTRNALTKRIVHSLNSVRPDTQVVEKLCRGLETTGYRSGPESVAGAPRDIARQIEKARHDARKNSLSRLIRKNDVGLLFLTDALTKKSGQDAYSTRLSCDSKPETREKDEQLVEAAIAEAKGNLDTYVNRLNEENTPLSTWNASGEKTLDAQLKKLLSENPTAFGEAMAELPNSASIACEAAQSLVQDSFAKENRQKATAVAAGGAAVVLSGGILSVPAAIIGNLSLSAALLAEQVHDADTVKAEQESILQAIFGGQAHEESLHSKNRELMKEYQELRLGWANAFGVAADSIEGLQLVKRLIAAGALGKSALDIRKLKNATETAKLDPEFIERTSKMAPGDRLNALEAWFLRKWGPRVEVAKPGKHDELFKPFDIRVEEKSLTAQRGYATCHLHAACRLLSATEIGSKVDPEKFVAQSLRFKIGGEAVSVLASYAARKEFPRDFKQGAQSVAGDYGKVFTRNLGGEIESDIAMFAEAGYISDTPLPEFLVEGQMRTITHSDVQTLLEKDLTGWTRQLMHDRQARGDGFSPDVHHDRLQQILDRYFGKAKASARTRGAIGDMEITRVTTGSHARSLSNGTDEYVTGKPRLRLKGKERRIEGISKKRGNVLITSPRVVQPSALPDFVLKDLKEGRPVALNWSSLTDQEVTQIKAGTITKVGGGTPLDHHSMVITGAKTRDGKIEGFLVQNTWSDVRGEGGYFYLPAEELRRLGEADRVSLVSIRGGKSSGVRAPSEISGATSSTGGRFKRVDDPSLSQPRYTNPGHHDPRSSQFRGGGSKTTLLPDDAESVFRSAIPDKTKRTWWGVSCANKTPVFYRYQPNGKDSPDVHWNGKSGKDPRDLAIHLIPIEVRRALSDRCKPK